MRTQQGRDLMTSFELNMHQYKDISISTLSRQPGIYLKTEQLSICMALDLHRN